jgi:hypothetical protein
MDMIAIMIVVGTEIAAVATAVGQGNDYPVRGRVSVPLLFALRLITLRQF